MLKHKRFREELTDLCMWFVMLVLYLMTIPAGI